MTFIFVSILKLAAQFLSKKHCRAKIKLMWKKKGFLEMTTYEFSFCEKNKGKAALNKLCLLCKLFIVWLMVSQLPDRCIISSGSGLINGPQSPGHRCIHLPGYGKPSQTNHPDPSSTLISHFLLPSFLFLFFLEKIPCSSLHCILTEISISLMQFLLSSFGFFTFILFFVYFLLRARVCWPLLCLCRPFYILERCLHSNPESCHSKQARHPSPYNLATHRPPT
jgi:hypothetical protein